MEYLGVPLFLETPIYIIYINIYIYPRKNTGSLLGIHEVFAQFDLGQKLIGPADTAFLEKAVCLNPLTWDFVGFLV